MGYETKYLPTKRYWGLKWEYYGNLPGGSLFMGNNNFRVSSSRYSYLFVSSKKSLPYHPWNSIFTQEIFQKLEEGMKNKEISEKELVIFLAEKTKSCYACGQKIEVEPEIINLEIHEDKIIAHLNNGERPEVPLEWFAKWGVKGVSSKKLKKFEIWEGEDIYFPEIDEVLGIEKFLGGFNASCK